MSSFALLFLLLPGAADRALAVRAEHVLLADGKTLSPGVVIVENGRIQRVGPEAEVAVPPEAGRIDHPGWLSAGLIALHGYSGATGELRDTTRAMLPEGRLVWAFDAQHPELRDLVTEGITSLVLTPSAASLSGGTSAVVKCAGGGVVTREAQLALGFSSQSLSFNRFPTSHGGALAELERLFQTPSGTIERCVQGELPALFEVGTPGDVKRAIEFARRFKVKGALAGAGWTGEVARDVKASGLSVIAPAMGVGVERRTLRSMVALGTAEIPFAFSVNAPFGHAASLRLAASLCMREGLARDKAWRGLTAESARIAGVEKRIGSIAEGLDADFVLWSGDPLELSSSVVAVYVDGTRVFAAEER